MVVRNKTFFVHFYVKTISVNASLQKQILLSYNLWNVLTTFDTVRNIRRHVIKKKSMKFLIVYSEGQFTLFLKNNEDVSDFVFPRGLFRCVYISLKWKFPIFTKSRNNIHRNNVNLFTPTRISP